MKMALFIILALFLLGVLSGIAWKRIKSRAKKVDLIAKSNHKSVWSFHYGPAPVIPVREPATAAPALTPDNPLSQLMPEEDFRAKEEQEIADEAARVEAAQAAEREETRVAFPAADEQAPAAEPEAPESAPLLASSRHAPGAFDVLALVGNDVPAPAPAAVAASQPVAASVPLDDEKVSQAIYDNALTEATRTKNDAANRQAAAELRKRKRAAFQAGTDGQKAALTALITETNAPL
ncbi:hypothetical protein [Hymenobacter antarcticus]|uniref:Uncharacterized protein n=1 Tax=Hymenobacter antarcticus TaxID=486270 RepID=A0ABP7QBU6_9BACT